jgi:hypothetical protein
MYLKVETAAAPKIDRDSIRGSLRDLAQLRDLVAARLQGAQPGDCFQIASDYSPDVVYPLRFEVQPERFDPAGADPALSGSAA